MPRHQRTRPLLPVNSYTITSIQTSQTWTHSSVHAGTLAALVPSPLVVQASWDEVATATACTTASYFT